jgi:hypothetical protein
MERCVTPQVHSTILHEIVRVIDARARVPERVRIRGREYQVAYLEDHKQRLEEAIRRRDADRLNMLYGQLASKVKYQILSHPANKAPKARIDPEKGRGTKWTATSRKAACAKKRAKATKKDLPTRGSKLRVSGAARG